MNKGQLIIAFLLGAIVIVLTLLNINNYISIEVVSESIRVNVGFVILAAAVLSSLSTIFYVQSQGWSPMAKSLKGQVESAKLKHEVETDKVKQLEDKVKTLEKALETITNS